MGTRRRSLQFSLLVLVVLGLGAVTALSKTTDWNVVILDQILAKIQPGQSLVQVGDMVFTVSFVQTWRNQLAGGPHPLLAFDGNIPIWTSGNVYYTFSNSVSTAHQKAFLDGMNEWATFANLTFISRTTQSNYVTIVDSGSLQSGGDSAVGMIGGQQYIHIGSTSWNRATICHEFGHTLGLVHEHQRSDRDSFVTIFTNNIIPGLEGNFVKLTNSLNETSYDFLSVMHYARNSLSINTSLDTIEPLPAFAQYLDIMGQQFDPVLSASDRTGMALRYGAPATPPTNIVTNTKDSGPGSLRAAMYYALDHPGTTITFNIPTSDSGFSNSVFTVKPTDGFPSMANAMVIDGTTEPTNSNPNGPEIVLNGSLAALPDVFANGLRVSGTNCTAKGLVINGFNGSGINIQGSNAVGSVIAGCYLGTDPSGTVAVSNGIHGVFIGGGAHGNHIGGTSPSARNVIAGNAGQGVFIIGTNTDANVVDGNFIGLNASGTAALSNAYEGVVISSGAKSNLVGGTAAGSRNIISGNIQGVRVTNPGTKGNLVRGNYIGLNAGGTNSIPNMFDGIIIDGGAQSNLVSGNVISGNGIRGIGIFDPGTDGNLLQGNFIGTDPTGSAAFPHVYDGIDVALGARSNQITGNLVSGNGNYGIGVNGIGTDGTTVQGNFVGVDVTGAAALGNQVGVAVYGGARLTQVGGTTPGAGNVLSGNASYNLFIADPGTTSNSVQGNYVGINAAGTAAIPNSTFAGLAIFLGAQSNTIGGGVGARNIVSGNATYGIFISDTNTDANVVQGNTVGLDLTGTIPLANGFAGAVIQNAARSNQIGGATLGAANLIASNSSYGVVLFDAATTNNLILGNSIFGNGSSGIVLSGGANKSRPPPSLTFAVLGTNTTIAGSLNSSSNATFRIEFFANPTGSGAQGKTFLGAINVTTGSGGTATFSAGLAGTVPVGQLITATATDPAGNTSPFSSSVTVSTTDSVGDGIPNAWRAAFFGGDGNTTNSQSCAACDADGDGLTNYQEFRAGTDPTTSASALRVSAVQQVGNNAVVSFATVAGKTYRVETKDDLALASWSPLVDQIGGTGRIIQVIDPAAATRTKRFYRVSILP